MFQPYYKLYLKLTNETENTPIKEYITWITGKHDEFCNLNNIDRKMAATEAYQYGFIEWLENGEASA